MFGGFATSIPLVGSAARRPGSKQNAIDVYSIRKAQVLTGKKLPMSKRKPNCARQFALFAALALVIAGVGIYGTLSYTVAQRTRELGIRIPLGAQRTQVFGMVIRQGMRSAAIGMLVGGLAALGATRSLASLLFGVTPADPLTFAMALLLLALVALAACYVPARRAALVNPMSILRSE